MSDISFDLSGKIDQKTVEALAIVKRVALGLNIPQGPLLDTETQKG
jgi:hypothetical protein